MPKFTTLSHIQQEANLECAIPAQRVSYYRRLSSFPPQPKAPAGSPNAGAFGWAVNEKECFVAPV